MTHSDTTFDKLICSDAWLKPIAHKVKNDGVPKLGLEMEMHAFDAQTLAPLGTKNSTLTPQDILKTIVGNTKDSSLTKDTETNEIIGVQLPSGGNFSLEPGGQLEYASVPCVTLTNLASDIQYGLELLEHAAQKGVLFLSHGTNPVSTSSHPLVVPKKRYQFMTRYFQSAPKNIRGIDMMRHSATVQPNIDIFETSAWHSGVQLILNLIPLTSCLFANSRYFQGQRSRFYSERQNIWENMDPTRSGIPENMLSNEGCPQTECTYAQWAKKAFMLFIESLELEQQPLYGEITFEQWFEKGYKNTHPTIDHWKTHLGTLFPHLRLRNFLEIRNIDAQPFEHSLAPIAFFAAVLKTKATQQKTRQLLSELTPDFIENFQINPENPEMFFPFLDLAAEILDAQKEECGVHALQAYKNFLAQREDYWDASGAVEFVKKSSTHFPAAEFTKHFQ